MEARRSTLPLGPSRVGLNPDGPRPTQGSRLTQGSNLFDGNNEHLESNVNQGNFNNNYIDQRRTYLHQSKPQNVGAAKPWTVMRAITRLYTGRQDIGQELERVFRPQGEDTPKEQRRFVISGLGGTGKSEVCIKFAHEHRREYRGVIWIDCKDEKTAQEGFERAGRLCGLADVGIASVNAWLSSTADRWLIIIDNADDPRFDYATYFPSGEDCCIIITTRNPDSWKRYSTVGHKHLDQLEPRLAEDLLLKAAGKQPISAPHEREAARHIVEELGRHTLAVLQAGAYISQSCEIEDYLVLYRKQRDRLFQSEREQEYSTYGTVHATFEVSVEQLEALRSKGAEDAGDALNLLDLLAFMHREGQFELILSRAAEYTLCLLEQEDLVDERGRWTLSRSHAAQLPQYSPLAVEGAEGKIRWRRAYRRLRSFSLVSVQDGAGVSTLSMHPLIHQWALERQSMPSRKRAWWQTMSVLALSCQGDRGYIPFFEAVKSHVRACLGRRYEAYLLDKLDLDVATSLVQLACVQCEMHDDHDLRHALRIVRAHLTEGKFRAGACGDILKLDSYSMEGQLLRRSGNTREAVTMLEHVVSVREKTLEETHPSRLASQYQLAGAYRSNGQIGEAIKVLEHVVGVEENMLEETHPSRLATQHALAGVYESNGRRNEAIKMLEYVVSVWETTLDETHPHRLASQHELARVYRSNNQISRAIEILEHVVSVKAKTLDETHPSRLTSQHTLAGAYMSNGQVNEAIEILEHVVSIREKMLDKMHPSRLGSQHTLAIAYYSNGQISEAIEILEHVVNVEEKTLDETHPSRLASQHALAEIKTRVSRQS